MRSRRKKGLLTGFKREFADVVNKYNRRNGPLLAKGLGFSFLFGLIPMLFLSVSLTAYLYKVTPGLQRFIMEDFLAFIPFGTRQNLVSHVLNASNSWETIGIMGILILLVVAMTLFDSIERTMATMLDAPRRKFHFARLISLALMVGAVLVFFGAAILSTVTTYFRSAFNISQGLVSWGGKLMSWLMFGLVLLGFFYLFARRRLKFWPTLGIALITSLLWQLVIFAGSSLIKYAGRKVIIYGALAWVTAILLYLRILAELVIFSSLFVSRASPSDA